MFTRLVLASAAALALTTATASADPLGCPYPATDDPAPADRSDVINGSVTGDDPMQTGRLAVSDTVAPAPTCTTGDTSPGTIAATSQFHYKSYVFHNYANAGACISATLYVAPDGHPLEVAAYAGSFVPTAIETNYVAAAHNDSLAVYQFSFNVAANADFTIVVTSAVPVGDVSAIDSGPYQLLVGGCGAPAAVDAGSIPPPSGAPASDGETIAGPVLDAGSIAPTAGTRSGSTALPANESFGDCSVGGGAFGDASLIGVAVALAGVIVRRRRRRDQPIA